MIKKPAIFRLVHTLFLVALFLALIIALPSSTVFAQGSGFWHGSNEEIGNYVNSFNRTGDSYLESRVNYEKAVAVENTPNLAKTTTNQMEAMSHWFTTGVFGGTIEEGQAVFGKGAVPILGSLIDNMYNYKPASSQNYIAYLLESSKIIPSAQAQGIGFSSLDPIMNVWEVFRNIAYFFFVILMMVIGFLIMFRHKVSGQTVITVQQAVPNIIVSLIFVTFSYAIGGLLIDAMYLLMYLIIGLFSASTNIINKSIFTLGHEFVTSGFDQANQAVRAIIEQSGLDLLKGIGGLTVAMIVAIALLYGTIKLFLELLRSYVSIILLIAFSPIILMTGAIPGHNSFGSWIKNLTGNLIAFPVTLLVLVVTQVIHGSGVVTGGFAPPFILGPTIGGGSALTSVVGLGMLLTTPEIVKKAKDAMGAKEGVIGELAGTAWNRFKQGVKPAANISTVGLGLGGAAVGGLGGIVGGTAVGKLRGDDWEHAIQRGKDWGKKGALGGGLAVPGIRAIPSFSKEIAQLASTELKQFAINETTDTYVNKLAQRQDLIGRMAQFERNRRAQRALFGQARTTFTPNQTVPTTTTSTTTSTTPTHQPTPSQSHQTPKRRSRTLNRGGPG